MNLKSIMFDERRQHKRLHFVWFHLYDLLEKIELLGQKSDQWFQEIGGEGGGLVTKEGVREPFDNMEIFPVLIVVVLHNSLCLAKLIALYT